MGSAGPDRCRESLLAKDLPRLIHHRRALSNGLLLKAVTGASFFTTRGGSSPPRPTINPQCLCGDFQFFCLTDLRRKSHLPTICQLFANCPGDPVQMQPGRSAPRLPTPSPKEADRAQAKSPHHHSGLAPSHIRANQIIAGKRIQTHRKSRRACLTILESQFQAPRDTSQRADRRTRKEARKV